MARSRRPMKGQLELWPMTPMPFRLYYRMCGYRFDALFCAAYQSYEDYTAAWLEQHPL